MDKIKNNSSKKLFVFDLDGTLTPSKAPIRRDMAHLLARLLSKRAVAVIGGGKYDQFQRQFISRAKFKSNILARLYLFPTSAAAFYRWQNGWKKVYAHSLPPATKKNIKAAFKNVFKEVGYRHPRKVYGRVIEDRGTQITFSAVGQQAPIAAKVRWNRQYDRLRKRIASRLQKKLPGLEVRTGGLTSIDVTRKGIDKAYGIRKISKALGIGIRSMLFIGDAIYPRGNDYAVVQTGIDYVKVRDPEETKKVIRSILAQTRNETAVRP